MKFAKSALFVLLAVFLSLLTACGATQTPIATQPLRTATTAPSPTATFPPTEVATNPSPSPTPVNTASPAPQGVLRVVAIHPAHTLNPITALSAEAAYLANVYETLVRVNPPGAKKALSGVLAERWEHDADGKVWTFYLRHGVTFHDGTPLTAEAVRVSLLAARRYGRADFLWRVLDKITVVDDFTVRFTLSQPVDLPRLLAAPYGAYIVSPAAIKAWQRDAFYFDEGHDGGTGPYTVADYKPNESLTLRAYPRYWKGWRADQVGTLKIVFTDQPEEWRQLLTEGKADIAMPFFAAERGFSPPAGYSVVRADSFVQMLVFFNTKHKPLADARIRRALTMATPSEKLAAALGGWARPLRSPLPPGLYPYSQAVKSQPYDPQGARQLLASLNAEGLHLTLTYDSESATQEIVAKALQKAYAAVGIALKLRGMPWRYQWENARAFPDDPETQDLFLMEYAPLYPDGADVLHTLFGSSERYFLNLSYWQNAEYERLLAQADERAAVSPQDAEQLYAKAMNLLTEQAPAAFLLAECPQFVLSKRVHGFEYNPYYPDVPIWFAQLTLAEK